MKYIIHAFVWDIFEVIVNNQTKTQNCSECSVLFLLQDFDRILSILNNLHEIYTDEDGPAIVFNCELGKGRTTTGMAIAALIYCNKKVNTCFTP